MTNDSQFLKYAKAFVSAVLDDRCTANFTFHNLRHIREVVTASRIIGRASNLTSEALETVQLAAWFLYVGHPGGAQNCEMRSALTAERLLRAWGADDNKISTVRDAILATQSPQPPRDIFGMVLCDADAFYLASSQYEKKLSRLRKELDKTCCVYYTSDRDWYRRNADFLKKHRYFTNYGKNILNRRKQENIKRLTKLQANGRADILLNVSPDAY